MKRPFFRPSGYTLVEILVATTLSLILLGAVVQMFGNVGRSITDSRSMLEMSDHLRLAATRLQQDLAGVTVTMNPPRRPENNEGYFEYIEGPVGATIMTKGGVSSPLTPAVNGDLTTPDVDTTAGDFDDILMFTTRSTGRPFVGRCFGSASGTVTSDIAEVAWFVRGRTLYRRVLLVAPSAPLTTPAGRSFYEVNDISVHPNGAGTPVANTLGDLTRRECRFAHPTDTFPYDVTRWNWVASLPTGYTTSLSPIAIPTLPTLRECSSSTWTVNRLPPTPAPTLGTLDLWTNDTSRRLSDQAFATSNLRIADNVILTNVIGFDVKAWDPSAGGTGQYVDMGNPSGIGQFTGNGAIVGYIQSGAGYAPQSLPRVYDTWSTHYEDVGTWAGDPRAGRATNGFDNAILETGTATNGLVDDDQEKLTHPPYPYPLRHSSEDSRV